MTENRAILDEAEVDFLLQGSTEDSADAPLPLDDPQQAVTMRGDLDQISLADIFQTLAMSKMEGVLRVRNPLEERQIYCCDGYVRILVPPRLTVRRLGQRLIQAGVLTAEQLRSALLEQRKEKLPIGQLLVQNGLINQEQLDEVIGMQVAEDLFALFTWRHGTFEFFKGEPGSQLLRARFESCPEYEVNSLLLEVARRSDEWQSILDTIGSLDEIPYRAAEPADPEHLSEAHRLVLGGTDGQSTYRQIADQTTLSLFDMARAARDLFAGGILQNLAEAEVVAVARRLAEEGETKRAILIVQTLDHRSGERELEVITGMARVLEHCGERRFASKLLLEAAQRTHVPEEALELARSARNLVPYEPGTLSFLRTVLVAHGSPDSPELEKVTVELLDAMIDGDLLPTALDILEDVRRTGTMKPQILVREARARQKSRDLPGAAATLQELAEAYVAAGNRPKAIEAYEAILRIDRTRKDVLRLVQHMRRTRLGRLLRVAAAAVSLAMLGGMGFVFWQQASFDANVQEADAEIGELLRRGDRTGAAARLTHWQAVLGECEQAEDLASRVAFAEATERGRLAKVRRAEINARITAAATALGKGEVRAALDAYQRLAAEPDATQEVQDIVATRLGALIDELASRAKGLDGRLPPPPDQVFDRAELTGNLASLQRACPPTLLRSFRELAEMASGEELPEVVVPAVRTRIGAAIGEAEANLRRAIQLAADYTTALERKDTERRLDPLFKSAVAKEQQFDFQGALEIYRELERLETSDGELRTHFRDRVTRNATIVRLLDELSRATRGGEYGTAQQHLRALRRAFPELPFDRLTRLPLRVDSEPTGGLVRCGGKDLGTTPLLLARVPADETEVSVSLPGFSTVCRTVQGDADGDAQWTARMLRTVAHDWHHDSSIELAPVPIGAAGWILADRAGNVLRVRPDFDGAAWTFRSGDLSGWLSRPIVADQHLLVASLDGNLRALDLETGEPAWELSDLATEVAPVKFGETLLVATTDGRLHSIDLAQRRRKSIDLGEPAHDRLIAAEERLLVVGERGLVAIYQLPDLTPVFRRKLETMGSAQVRWQGATILVADDQGHLIALDSGTGERRWQRSLDTILVGPPLVCDGLALLATPSQIVRIRIADGTEEAPFPASDSPFDGPPAATDGLLCVPLRDGPIQVMDRATGRSLYRLAGERKSKVTAVGDEIFVYRADHRVQHYPAMR